MSEQIFLGTGWGFPIIPHKDVQTIGLSRAAQNVRESIWIILSTAKGERQMRPTFGCGIHDLVFGLNQQDTLGKINAEVREALQIWEPRIDVLAVTTVPDLAQSNQLNVELSYQIRATNSRFNLVYPFFLES